MNTLNHFLTISVAVGVCLGGIMQKSFAQSRENQAFIEQISSENRAEIMQGAANTDDLAVENVADVYQNGYQNEALIQQGYGNRSSSVENTAETMQRGDGHTVFIEQGTREGFARDNSALVEQSNDFHEAGITQGTDGALAENNEATIDQQGQAHKALIRQGADFKEAKENIALIGQRGSMNQAGIYQGAGGEVRTSPNGPLAAFDSGSAEGSLAIIEQSGTEHYAVSIQNFSTNDLAEISQRNSGNFARVAQGVMIPQ